MVVAGARRRGGGGGGGGGGVEDVCAHLRGERDSFQIICQLGYILKNKA